jgi:Zn-dependent peptidase ImmA (M78 family)
MTSKKMQGLYERLEIAGLPQDYVVQKILPEWWSDEIAESPAGYLEAISYIAKHLGIPLSDLRDPDNSLAPQNAASARFKLREGVNVDDVTWARALAIRAAEITASATDRPCEYTSTVNSGLVRQQILDSGEPWINLSNLIDFCWNAGIPVIHLPDVPGNKMDGMAIRADDRPVIVLSLNKKHEAWLLFILAHELGHILRGHLDEDEAWVDEEFDLSATEVHEQEANSFAVELITGDPGTEASATRYPKARRLAKKALQAGRKHQIDPGALILNFAYHESGNVWALASAALNALESDPRAPSLVRAKVNANLNWDLLPKESADFLRRLMGPESADHGSKAEAVTA